MARGGGVSEAHFRTVPYGYSPIPNRLRAASYRVTVVAPQFKALKHSERQSLVWRIAERVLSPNEQLRISMILTLTRDEAAGK